MTILRCRLLKNLEIESWSLSNQCRSLHGFQTSHFICNRFDCKLWLLSIQNHVRVQPDIVSKFWHTAIWSCNAVRSETEQRPFSWNLLRPSKGSPQFGSKSRKLAQFWAKAIWSSPCKWNLLLSMPAALLGSCLAQFRGQRRRSSI